MVSAEVNSNPPRDVVPGVSRAAMENLAVRMRQGGLSLLLVKPDGTVGYADSAPAPFFQKYVLPALQERTNGDSRSLAAVVGQMTATSPIEIWPAAPGVLAAAFPHVEKRAVTGVVVLVAKCNTFRLSEEVLRTAGKIGLDGIWLAQQADGLPGYGEEALHRQARILLSMVRDQLKLTGLEYELESLSGQLSNTYEELSLIYQLSSGMKINRSPSDFFKQACINVAGVMDVKAMGVVLRGEGALNQPPVVYGSIAPRPEMLRRLSDHLVRACEKRQGVVLINHLSRDPEFAFFAECATQLLAVPLSRGEQVLGCLFALDKNVDEFSSTDSKLLTSISNESSVYLENAILFDDVHGLMMGLLHSLTSAVDAKDAYTCGHSERVALLSRHLAVAAGMSEPQADRVYMAGLLHDVGKIGVPEAVLQKTGRLTTEEFEQIKRHPEIGARILSDIKQIADVIPGVMHHHERFDGRGYPGGLAGDDIPLMGRIICLADCFDAMTSSRTYRKALPIEVAMTEICRCAGTQFDPKLADAFLKINPEELRDLLKNHTASLRRVLEQPPALRAA